MQVTNCESLVPWLETRRNHVCSSDIAGILGVAWTPGGEPFSSPLSLWVDKTSTSEIEEEDESLRFKIGHKAEKVIHELAHESEEIDGDLYDPGDFTIATDDWKAMTVDRLVVPTTYGKPAGLTWEEAAFHHAKEPAEFKTVSPFAADGWDEEPNLYTLVQAHWQMIVGGWDSCVVCALIGFDRFNVYHVQKHEALAQKIEEEAYKFWQYVQQGTPPPPDASEATTAALQRMYPKQTPDSVVEVEGEEWISLLKRRAFLREHQKEVRSDLAAIDNKIKAALGDTERLRIAGWEKEFTWKEQHRKEHVVAASSSRVLREVKAKP